MNKQQLLLKGIERKREKEKEKERQAQETQQTLGFYNDSDPRIPRD